MNTQSLLQKSYDADLIRIGINKACALVYDVNAANGWYTDPQTMRPKVERNFGELIALCHSELSEALEAHRKNLMDDKLPHRSGAEVELADCVIRIMDMCVCMGFDLAGALLEKVEYNSNRADHKLENRIKDGGKKY